MEKRQVQTGKVLLILKSVVISYLVTAILLLVISFLMFKAGLDEKKASIGIIMVYVFSTFLGGRTAGKGVQTRKFLWGMLAGGVYFVLLLLLIFAMTENGGAAGMQLATTLVLCLGGGMLGGMLSA